MIVKRIFDLVLSVSGLLFLAPIFCMLAILIKLDSRGPVFFRQVRVGQYGRHFRIHKFRTMTLDQAKTSIQITVGADPRITRTGKWLRKYKIDELPQLIDVFIGKMSIVGPRPEVPKYIAKYPKELRDLVLSLRPGITDRASLEFRDENSLLAQSNDPESDYIEKILPIKQRYYVQYVQNRSLWIDIRIIFQTLYLVFMRSSTP